MFNKIPLIIKKSVSQLIFWPWTFWFKSLAMVCMFHRWIWCTERKFLYTDHLTRKWRGSHFFVSCSIHSKNKTFINWWVLWIKELFFFLLIKGFNITGPQKTPAFRMRKQANGVHRIHITLCNHLQSLSCRVKKTWLWIWSLSLANYSPSLNLNFLIGQILVFQSTSPSLMRNFQGNPLFYSRGQKMFSVQD